MKHCLTTLIVLTAAQAAAAAELRQARDPETGWTVYTVTQGQTRIKLVPAAGCNVYSIEHAGRELLKQPKSLKELPGFMYGNPVLYPMPNRVRDAEFKFGDKTYRFEANNGKNFLHGLVHNVPWEVTGVEQKGGQTTIRCQLPFVPGTKWYELFPHQHVLKLDVTVSDGAVRFAYTVDNTQGESPVPFGFAYHPWFLYQGARANTYLTIPASHWMEAEELLPTGKLVPLAGTKFDLRQPRALEGFVIDDVYYGLAPQQPTVVDFRDAKLKLELAASADFTHLVVYTPQEPWFCVENQTCSTDAHNLFARGLKKESHLQIVEPGKSHSGYAEFRFKPY